MPSERRERPVRLLQKKLSSQKGASLLLALLFLLICMMVAASVLMAALSNAGKLRSNREEQQSYLILSSALRLVCGELAGTEYQGQYTYTYEPEIRDSETGALITPEKHLFTQQQGRFQCGLAGVLPLGSDLDALFAQRFQSATGEKTPLPGPPFGGEYQLTLAADLDTTAHPELASLARPVAIACQMRTDGVIRLTATLSDQLPGAIPYTMEAELTPSALPGSVLVLSGSPTEGLNQTETIRWELNWIAKKGAS